MDQPTAYDDDVYAWAYEQAALLRGLRETRPDLPNALDVENLSEEIEGLARKDLREAQSFLRLLLVHLLKIASAPESDAVEHWRLETGTFQADFETMLTPTILRKIETDKTWRQAVGRLALEGDVLLPNLPATCPILPRDLATETFDVDAAVSLIRESATPQSAA